MARPFLKDNAYTSIFRRIKTKEPLDPELRIRVTLAKMCVQKKSREFSKHQLLSVFAIVFPLH